MANKKLGVHVTLASGVTKAPGEKLTAEERKELADGGHGPDSEIWSDEEDLAPEELSAEQAAERGQVADRGGPDDDATEVMAKARGGRK